MKIDKFEGDIFWNAEDREMDVEPEEYMNEVGCGIVIQFSQAKSLPDFYGVQYYESDKDEYVDVFFTTLEEAEDWVNAHPEK
jgi:hypothetical protein